VGCPYRDKTNLTRGTRGKNGDVHCAGDVWFLPYSTTGAKKKKKHAYEYPEELVEKCIKLANLSDGGIVYDPFCGSGTSVCVAKRLGFNAVASDLCQEALDAAQSRWESTPASVFAPQT
jgi:site-specific DNA-methyltransferase (adenine-specific)